MVGAMPLVLIMAGGTGGHVYPALAVASELLERGYRVEWVGTNRGLEIQPGHTKCGITHEGNTHLVGRSLLGANHQRNRRAQVGGFAPTDIAVRLGRGVEGRHLVSGGTGVVGDDAVFPVQILVQLPDHPVRG